MLARNWARVALGVLLIAAVYVVLWLEFGPRWADDEEDRPASVRLADAEAEVTVRDGPATRRASIACDGDDRRASGFWAHDPVEACDALGSTRSALLSGPGCARIGRRRVGIVVTGSFGTRRFEHRAVRGGCPDPDGWLAVNALALPVVEPDQELDDREAAG